MLKLLTSESCYRYKNSTSVHQCQIKYWRQSFERNRKRYPIDGETGLGPKAALDGLFLSGLTRQWHPTLQLLPGKSHG